MHAAWLERKREAIDRVIDERPEAFLSIVARTIIIPSKVNGSAQRRREGGRVL
jgi:hypothetical protein